MMNSVKITSIRPIDFMVFVGILTLSACKELNSSVKVLDADPQLFEVTRNLSTDCNWTRDCKKADSPVKKALRRIAHGRIFQHDKWTLGENQSVRGVAEALADLKPSYVTGLLRFDRDEEPLEAHIEAFNRIRKKVRETSPEAKFDLVLNALHYRSVDEVVKRMRYLNSKFAPDIWYFDFFQTAYAKGKGKGADALPATPEVVMAAIKWAHDHGQLIGGNTFGHQMPPNSDFAGVNDNDDFSLNLEAIAQLRASGFQVVMHLNNNPQNGSPDSPLFDNPPEHEEEIVNEEASASCQFMYGKTGQRKSYVKQLAKGQEEGDYHLMFPVFFPMCPIGTAYDSTTDGDMFDFMKSLMDSQ